MKADRPLPTGPETSQRDPNAPGPRRLFLHEPGWRIFQKVGSEKSYCYMMVPGQDYYHRLLDGELFLSNADERLCLACAERRGLLAFENKNLRAPVKPASVEVNPETSGEEFSLKLLDEA